MPTPISQAKIAPADLFFWKGQTPFSRAIKRRTASEYSHVALAVPVYVGGGKTQTYCVEAVAFHGVRLFPMQRYLADYPTEEVDWFHLAAESADRWAVLRYCLGQIGNGYASPRQFSYSFGWIGPVWRRLTGAAADIELDREFCSELVSAGLQQRFVVPKEPALMSPQDVADLPFVWRLESLVAG